ncbi:MAG: HEPN domain-containing protein [Bryobacterales bacterium]|nr:HEPN domain-containing protein [Bryobacterales bacterium]
MKDARALLAAGRFAAAYYLAGYAVECALKACIAKQTRRYDFPSERKWSEKVFTHDLSGLLKHAKLEALLSADARARIEFAANWNTVKDWGEESRYQATSRQNAEALYRAVADRRHGVLRWLKQHW